jgi:hypothetical protein
MCSCTSGNRAAFPEGSLSSPSGLGLFAKALPFPAKQAKARMHGQVERKGFDVSARKIAQSRFQMTFSIRFLSPLQRIV